MKNFKTINQIKKIALLAIMLAASILPLANINKVFADDTWGPKDRATFTWDNPAPYRTFNSITDNPVIGDERNFVRVKEVGTEDKYLDEVDVYPGKEYEVYIYFHNNASASLNDSGQGIADNVRLSTNLPEKLEAGQTGAIRGTISSTNTDPASVWDMAFLNAKDTVYMRYAPDSATIHSFGTADGAILDANALFSEEGAKLAYNLANANGTSMWGMIPGCNEYAGYVTYRLKADQPEFSSTKEVSAEGKNTFADNINTIPGATLDFKITYKNTGTTEQKSVTVYDTLPDGVEYIPGSVQLTTSAGTTTLDDKLFGNGVVIGDYQPGEEATITYKAKLSDNTEKFPCGGNTIYNNSEVATANGTITDRVRIVVDRACELPNTGPVEIVMAAVIVLGICGGGYYLYRTKKTLKVVEDNISGKDIASNTEEQNDKTPTSEQ